MTKPIRLAILLVALCTVAFAQSTDVNLLLSTLPAGKDPQRYKGYVEPQFKAITQRALYLTMRDGVKIAVTVVLPRDLPADQKIPAILAELKFGLHPISVLVKKGHRLRVAIAGHDKDTFIRIPAEGTPEIAVQRNVRGLSMIELPVIKR
jgi:predicted acyl esterase